MNARRHARQVAFQQEERMAKFVALVSVVFLVTWLPVTVRLFCNTFCTYPSNHLDAFSLRLVIANFVLDPITYVLLKRSFKRNLTRSITELTEFLGDVRLSRKLNRQTTRVEDEAKLGNTSGFGFGHFADTSIIEVDRPRNENLVPVS